MHTLLDHCTAHGTPLGFTRICLADGHTIDIRADRPTPPDPVTTFDVYLPDGVEAPRTDTWPRPDAAALREFCGEDPVTGALYPSVPVHAIRTLVHKHGGETSAGRDDKVVAMPLTQLRAAGVRCLEDGGHGGYYIRVPLADGTDITFAGTSTDDTGAHPDVSIHHPVREHGGWSAQWSDGGTLFADVYHSHDEHLPYMEDTVALVDAVLARTHRCGGSAPESGAGDSAEQLALNALAEQGLTAHPDHAYDNPGLVIGRPDTGELPSMDGEPYIVLCLYNSDDDEWVMDRPPARPGDQWHVVTGDGTGDEKTLTTRPADQLAPCIAAITDWHTAPRT